MTEEQGQQPQYAQQQYHQYHQQQPQYAQQQYHQPVASQQTGQPAGPTPHAGYAPNAAPAGYPTGRPGLLDTSFATSTTAQTAKLAYVSLIVLCAVLALVGLFGAISEFAAIEYVGVTAVLGGMSSLLLYGGLAFAVLTVGRLVVDFFVQADRNRR